MKNVFFGCLVLEDFLVFLTSRTNEKYFNFFSFFSTFVLHIQTMRWTISHHPLNVRSPTHLSSLFWPPDNIATSLLITTSLFALIALRLFVVNFVSFSRISDAINFGSCCFFVRFSMLVFEMSSDVNCVLCLSALSNGSFGMQLGNLLSVFHIMWHVYDPNKFKMSIFLFVYKFIGTIISAFIFASSFFSAVQRDKNAFNVRACVWQFLSKDDNFSTWIRTMKAKGKEKEDKTTHK